MAVSPPDAHHSKAPDSSPRAGPNIGNGPGADLHRRIGAGRQAVSRPDTALCRIRRSDDAARRHRYISGCCRAANQSGSACRNHGSARRGEPRAGRAKFAQVFGPGIWWMGSTTIILCETSDVLVPPASPAARSPVCAPASYHSRNASGFEQREPNAPSFRRARRTRAVPQSGDFPMCVWCRRP